MPAITPGETTDRILGGALTIVQPAAGYRFSIDSILLARFASVRTRDHVLELGAGCGVIAVAIAALHHPRAIVALELQAELADLAARNAAVNGCVHFTVFRADLRRRSIPGLAPASFDVTVANPPYRALRTGRDSPVASRRLARGESAATLTSFVSAARRYTRDGGRAAFVFTASRAAELIATLRRHCLEPKRIRFVYPRADLSATAILIEARKRGGAEVAIEPPLILYDAPGIYSTEARRLLLDPP